MHKEHHVFKAAHHKAMAGHHEGAAAAHDKMAAFHKAKHDSLPDDHEDKAFHMASHEYHKAKAAFHKASKHELHKAAADHHTRMAEEMDKATGGEAGKGPSIPNPSGGPPAPGTKAIKAEGAPVSTPNPDPKAAAAPASTADLFKATTDELLKAALAEFGSNPEIKKAIQEAALQQIKAALGATVVPDGLKAVPSAGAPPEAFGQFTSGTDPMSRPKLVTRAGQPGAGDGGAPDLAKVAPELSGVLGE